MQRAILALILTMSATASAMATDSYEIDPAHTQIVFSVDRFGFTTIFGSFMESGGTITLDADHPENSSVQAFVGTGSVFAGDPTRDAHIAGPHWLNAEEYPRLTFDSTAIELTGDDTARVTGNLTIWGVAREVILDVRLNRLGTDPATRRQAVGFTITGEIDRSDWGHQTAASLIGQEIGIRIETLAYLLEE
ncbi:YceI family protein [Hyphobacterium sp. HN65]|uniref:YceI family protein n=1 Tax=Hyphobacterium lacteum TaxID=3116575 RepID=A0ABU7LNX6_9PROT|nr:YceI family protein [Hyphobacterium sp. HN65]MEE2525621.1 YceI family protein [Hyphobacterium sp. HN65]